MKMVVRRGFRGAYAIRGAGGLSIVAAAALADSIVANVPETQNVIFVAAAPIE